MNRPWLSVIIPAFNEEQRLGETLRRVTGYLLLRGKPFQVIVVDDGSNDGTGRIASEFASQNNHRWELKVLRNTRNRGKGYSVRRGMLECSGEYALLTDADLSVPIEELPKLEAPIFEGGSQIAFGSRDVDGSRTEIPQSLFRETSGKIYNRLMRLLTGLPYRDTQCGFKLFDLEKARPIFQGLRCEGFSFDVEILYVARQRGLEAAEVPIVWRNAEGSKVGLRSGLSAVVDLLRIRFFGESESKP